MSSTIYKNYTKLYDMTIVIPPYEDLHYTFLLLRAILILSIYKTYNSKSTGGGIYEY